MKTTMKTKNDPALKALRKELEGKIATIAKRRSPRPFDHNRVSIILRQVAQKYGYDTADAMVRKYKLEGKFGIREAKKG